MVRPDPPIRELYAVIERRSLDELRALLAEDVRWSAPASIPGGGIRRGPAAVLEGAALLFEAVPEVDVHLDRVVVDGEQATVHGRYELPGAFELAFNDALVFRDGLLVSMLSRYDAAALVRAQAREG